MSSSSRLYVSLQRRFARGGVDELHRDPHLRARLADTAFEHMPYVQSTSNRVDPHLLALEGEGGSAERDPEFGDLRQDVEEPLRNSVGEVLLVRRRAHVCEREDCD